MKNPQDVFTDQMWKLGRKKIDLALKFLVWMHGKDGLSIYNGRILKKKVKAHVNFSQRYQQDMKLIRYINSGLRIQRGSLGCV